MPEQYVYILEIAVKIKIIKYLIELFPHSVGKLHKNAKSKRHFVYDFGFRAQSGKLSQFSLNPFVKSFHLNAIYLYIYISSFIALLLDFSIYQFSGNDKN